MLPRNRPPTPPGEVLLHEFLRPKRMTQVELAAKMNVPIQRVNGLISGRRSMTPETAILLSKELGVSPEFWMNLQTALDLWHAAHKMQRAA